MLVCVMVTGLLRPGMKGCRAPSFWSPVSDEERMRSLGDFFLVEISIFLFPSVHRALIEVTGRASGS